MQQLEKNWSMIDGVIKSDVASQEKHLHFKIIKRMFVLTETLFLREYIVKLPTPMYFFHNLTVVSFLFAEKEVSLINLDDYIQRQLC